MKSEIEEALKGETEEFYIDNNERIALCELLACVAAALKTGKLWFNKEGIHNQWPYIKLCDDMAKRFANMPINKEN